jgi:hypothetical protein
MGYSSELYQCIRSILAFEAFDSQGRTKKKGDLFIVGGGCTRSNANEDVGNGR